MREQQLDVCISWAAVQAQAAMPAHCLTKLVPVANEAHLQENT